MFKVVTRLIAGVLGMVYRPLQHLVLTLGLYVASSVITPFYMFASFYNDYRKPRDIFYDHRPKRSVFSSLSLSTVSLIVLLPIAYVLLTVATSLVMLATVALSPVIGLVQGLEKGMKSIFKPTWLVKSLAGMFKRVFDGMFKSDVSGRYHQALVRAAVPNHSHVVLDNRFENGARAARNHHIEPQLNLRVQQPSPVLVPPAYVPNSPLNNNADYADVLRVSFEENQARYSARNLVRHAFNLYRQPGEKAAYVYKLADQLQGMQAIAQEKLEFLSDNELNTLREMKSEEVQAIVRRYQANVNDNSCILSLSCINEIAEPVTLEVQMNAQKHVYVFEAKELEGYFRSKAEVNEMPEIIALRPQEWDGLFLAENNLELSGVNSANSQLKVYRGINPEMYQTLQQDLQALHKILQAPAIVPEVDIQSRTEVIESQSSSARVWSDLVAANSTELSLSRNQVAEEKDELEAVSSYPVAPLGNHSSAVPPVSLPLEPARSSEVMPVANDKRSLMFRAATQRLEAIKQNQLVQAKAVLNSNKPVS